MRLDRIKTLLMGMASINRMLIEETIGDAYWDAVTEEFTTYLSFAGTQLEDEYRKKRMGVQVFEVGITEQPVQPDDTQELVPAIPFNDELLSLYRAEQARQMNGFGG